MMEAGGSSRVAAGGSRSGDSGPGAFGRSGESLENADGPPLAGFGVLGFQDQARQQASSLPPGKIRRGVHRGSLYAYPTQPSIQPFMDPIRQHTRRKAPCSTGQLMAEINPIIRGGLIRLIPSPGPR